MIDPATVWPAERFAAAPDDRLAEGFHEPGLDARFLDGPLWRGEPSRIFAWYGQPTGLGPFPAMVLVHGGGGTAFADWVRLWTARGYAAIAIDTCGCTPGGEHGNRPRHAHGGPPGWGGWAQSEEPLREQWPWHATAAVLLATAWLRAQAAVDPARIGCTGISWGGVISCWAASAEPRLACAAPVYGCGFQSRYGGLAAEDPLQDPLRSRWCRLWDPQHFLSAAAVPMLWLTGTTDFAFPLDDWAASGELPQWPALRSVQPGMLHGQEQGARPREILAFAEHHLRGGPALPRVGAATEQDGLLVASAEPGTPIRSAEIVFTTEPGPTNQRRWLCAAAELVEGRLQAPLPTGCTGAVLSLRTPDGLVSSSRPWWPA